MKVAKPTANAFFGKRLRHRPNDVAEEGTRGPLRGGIFFMPLGKHCRQSEKGELRRRFIDSVVCIRV